ncbi:efflux RND transporter periplasmic adaptor subunit [Chthonobacter albigriseus]|uniref:efflux RND transporter periplasmic adaptor subunit n=1 Tax=Chthonobacter albigriseus TaxID=1683161 RepID=UPI0015EF303A|nr:efflux RND transporter periplasmic adaptor subunit [Chthonobacter albigriseus]
MTAAVESAPERRRVEDVLKTASRTGARRRWRSRMVWTVVAVALLGGGYAWWASRSAVATTYATAVAARGALTVEVTATGSIYPTNQVEVGSELSGTVRAVNVTYNSPVRKGDVLAELDTDKLDVSVASARAKLAASRAKVSEADATIRQSQAEYDRKVVLLERTVISAQELETSKAALDRAIAARTSAEADVEVAAADLRLAETNLTKAKILSPIDGVVLSRSVDPGQTVAASLQAPVLFSLAEDLKRMELRVDVDEADVGRVAIGQAASFAVDAYPDRTFPASIRDIRFASETVQNVVTYKALLDVDNRDLALRPGMTATADIVVEHHDDALLVPNAALRWAPPAETAASSGGLLSRLLPRPPQAPAKPTSANEGRQRTLYVLKDGVPSPVMVETGSSDDRNTIVASGDLAPGDAVVVDSTTKQP